MRIPTSLLHRRALEGIQANLREVERATRELASGKRISAPSDDPAAARSILRSNSALEANRQFVRNISGARSLLGLEDVALQQLGDLLARGRELAVSQAGSTANPETREVAAREVEGLIEFLKDLGNTRLGDRHVFGGSEPSLPPFGGQPLPPAPLPTGDITVEISAGRTTPVSHSAARVFGDTGALAALEELVVALRENDPEAIHGAGQGLSRAHSEVQLLVGEVGSRMNRLDLAENRIGSLDLALIESRSNLEDVDFEAAVSRLIHRQTAYEAALGAASRIFSLNLADYFR